MGGLMYALIAAGIFSLTVAQEWGYIPENGPDTWPDNWPICSDSDRQSPVDISLDAVRYEQQYGDLILEGFAETADRTFTLGNKGHNVQVDVSGDGIYDLSGGNLPHHYRLYQFHFHWGSTNSRGSEHTVDGAQYPMEIHFVHWDVDEYDNAADAESEVDGLAVIGVFVEVGSHNDLFQTIVDALPDIPFLDDTTSISTFSLEAFLPTTSRYYRYLGSLTTPPCYESKVWTILNTTIQISQQQLDAFRSNLFTTERGNNDSVPLIDNFRSPQPISNRAIYSNFDLNNAATKQPVATTTAIPDLNNAAAKHPAAKTTLFLVMVAFIVYHP